jgi:primary-amine oxidase
MTSATTVRRSAQHPLDPLDRAEIAAAIELLRAERGVGPAWRFVCVVLHEPAKAELRAWSPGDVLEREAFCVVIDPPTRTSFEAIVALTSGRVRSWRCIDDPGQPPFMLDDFVDCESAVKRSPAFIDALTRRGITDIDSVMVDPWSAGSYGLASDEGRRLAYARCWVRSGPGDNGYAHPIDGVIPVVDLHAMEVVRVEDHGVVPLPPAAGNYDLASVGPLRDDLKPLSITQPDGPSFGVTGHAIEWQKWSFRFGFTPREGLVLYDVGYRDDGVLRSIFDRASLAEMVVPYGDPRAKYVRQNAFDAGEYNIGGLANSLRLGCDCLGDIAYFDAHLTDSRGNVATIPQAICLHEEDHGILWKHTDWRTNDVEVRRSRRLVISWIATVANYEYGFFWYFYLDGTVQFEVKLTGIVNTAAVAPGERPRHGTLIAPGLNAIHHQHFFNVRLDMSVDGARNSVYEVHTEAEPLGPDNPAGNAFFTKETLLETELGARGRVDPLAGRFWKIVNHERRNALGEPTAYKLIPGENILPFAHPESSVMQRAGFIAYHLWVTPYAADERYAAGEYPNQHPGGAGLPAWTRADRAIVDTDIVVWYTLGTHHIVRPEDWPVMPVAYLSFALKPSGFFDRNPALDVPPASTHGDACCDVPSTS